MRWKVLLAVLVCSVMTVWTLEPVFAAGGKNQGDTGTGETSIGSDAQGEAEQDRAGRADSNVDDVDELMDEILGG